KVQNYIDIIFYRQKVDLQNILEDFIEETKQFINKENIVKIAYYSLDKALNPSFIAIFVKEKQDYVSLKDSGLPEKIDINKNMPYQKYFLKINEKEIGFILIGNKKSETNFTQEEKSFLKEFSGILAN